MTQEQVDEIKLTLLKHKASLEALEASRLEAQSVVELDQTRTGRLSRMDALQGQAMAMASNARASLEIRKIDAALARIEKGEYGECLACGDDIAEARLIALPTATLCVACAAAREKR